MKILIAEDDSTARTMLAELLTKTGYDVVETVNGVEAWSAMQSDDPPQMAILDWIMPELDGLELVRRIRALEHQSPPYILMLTAKDKTEDVIAGLDAGADDYLCKPFDVGEFNARVEVGRRMVNLQNSLIKNRVTLAREAHRDLLTGVFSRRSILKILNREIERTKRFEDCLAVGICDVDRFKQVNDTHGLEMGDAVLRELTQILLKGTRQYDAVGRIGGEKFLIMTSIRSGIKPAPVYERLRAAIAMQEISTQSGTVSVTVSMGVACASPESTAEELLERAERALERAKDEGRNRVIFDSA